MTIYTVDTGDEREPHILASASQDPAQACFDQTTGQNQSMGQLDDSAIAIASSPIMPLTPPGSGGFNLEAAVFQPGASMHMGMGTPMTPADTDSQQAVNLEAAAHNYPSVGLSGPLSQQQHEFALQQEFGGMGMGMVDQNQMGCSFGGKNNWQAQAGGSCGMTPNMNNGKGGWNNAMGMAQQWNPNMQNQWNHNQGGYNKGGGWDKGSWDNGGWDKGGLDTGGFNKGKGGFDKGWGMKGAGGGHWGGGNSSWGNKGGWGKGQGDGYGSWGYQDAYSGGKKGGDEWGGKAKGKGKEVWKGGKDDWGYGWQGDGPAGKGNDGSQAEDAPAVEQHNYVANKNGGKGKDQKKGKGVVTTVVPSGPLTGQQETAISALSAASKQIIQNTVSTSKKKKAQMKAEAAKQRKLLNPLTGEALAKVERKNFEVDKYHAGKVDVFLIGEHTWVKRHEDDLLRTLFGVRGLDTLHPKRRKYLKFSCVYDVQVQDEQHEFTVVARLGGNDGENLRNIVRTYQCVHLSLHGKKGEPLVIKIDTNHQPAYEFAMQQIENILHKVYLQLDAWSVDKDFVGKNINLKVHKVERNTDYETIFPPPPPWVLEQMARDEEARRAKPSVIDANPLVKAVGPEQAEEGAALEPKKISAQDALAAFAGFGGGTAKTLPMPTLLRRSKPVAKKPTQDVQTLPTVQETAEDEGSASTTAKKSIALGVPTIAPPTTAPMPAAPVTAVPVVVEVVAAYA